MIRRWIRIAGALFIACALVVALRGDSPAEAQHHERWPDIIDNRPIRTIVPSNTFTFCRVQYDSAYSWNRWSVDYPESDLNFSMRLDQLTTIDVKRRPDGRYRHDIVRLDEPRVFSYPFLYMLEVGELAFSEREVAGLREYLLRGGFLMVDDFWGDAAWDNWVYEFSRVLPPAEFPIVDIPLEHPLFHMVFELDEVPQVPSVNHYNQWLYTGNAYEERHPATDKRAHCRGVFDTDGRLMAVFMHNTDLGDGWEREGVDERYFRDFSAKRAYPMGINIVVYAMTH